MLISYVLGQGSVVLRVKILNSSLSTGAGLTGLTSASAGLIISTIADNEAAATPYTQAGGTIETIATLGTYAAPTATKCRFKEVDATNHPGVYEIHLADARYAVTSAKSLLVSISGAANCAQTDALVPLTQHNPYSGDAYTRIGAAGAGLTNLGDARLANLDATVGSRAAPGAEMDLVDAPNATAITAIQAGLSTLDAQGVWEYGTRTLTAISDSTGVTTLLARLTTARAGYLDALAGITSLAAWLRAGLRKDTADATALSEINTGGGAYAEATDSQEAAREKLDASSIGSGDNPVTISLVDSEGNAVANLAVVVWNSGETARLNYDTANSSGQALFNLDAGTYKVAVLTPSAYVNPGSTTLTVTNTGAQALTITLTPQSVTPAAGADQIVGVLDTYDSQGALEASVAITIKMLEGPGDTGQSHDTAEITATSNGSGRVTVSLLQGAKYKARRGSTSRWEEFTCPTTGTSFLLPEVLGTE